MTVDLRAAAAAWLAAARPAVVVQVLQVRGSVPRDAGTRMLVAADAVLGSIGGGHLELQAIADARKLLSGASADAACREIGIATDGAPHSLQPVEQQIALGPTLGQCCGGTLRLQLAPLTAAALHTWPAPAPLFVLQLYGAGHVGRAIVQLLAGIDCRVQWIDQRDSEFPDTPLPPHIDQRCVEPVEAEVASAPPGCCYLVLTHSHALDMAISLAILRRGDFGFFGLIGSKTKRARFERRLAERGVAASALQRIVCPIGVPGIAGKEPAVIAIAVVAQLLQQTAR